MISKGDPAKCVNLFPRLPEHIQNSLNSKHSVGVKRGVSKGVNNDEKARTIFDNRADQSEHHKRRRTAGQIVEVTRRVDAVK